VNLDPGVVACHEPERIYRGIDRVLEIVGGRPQCVMGTGALPLEKPPENMRLIREYVLRDLVLGAGSGSDREGS
jgi:hypothetical protein